MPRIAGLNAGESPVGAIEAYGGTTAPNGWLLCNGASLLRADYPQLFAKIGTAFGAPNGNEFRVPDLRGRFLRGVAAGQATDPDRAGRTAMNLGGNAGDQVGSIQGHAFASHDHQIYNTGNPHAIAPGNLANDSNHAVVSALENGFLYNGISDTGGSETRPVNAYANFIIKYI